MLRLVCSRCISNRVGLLIPNSNCYSIRNFIPHVQFIGKYYSSDTNTNKPVVEVYYGILTPQIRAVKLFSLISSLMGLGAQPILYQQASNLGAPVTVALFGFVGFFTFVTPFLLHSITKKYVTRLHFNSDSEMYSATTLNFFLKEKKVTFKKDEVVVPDVPGMFTSFHVKGWALFVDPRLFGEPTHYAKLMGYDKPLDFKLSDDHIKSNPEEKK